MPISVGHRALVEAAVAAQALQPCAEQELALRPLVEIVKKFTKSRKS